MFDYTRAASRKIKSDIDKISLGLSIVSQLLSICYIFYITLFGSGNLGVKITLLTLSVGYFVFFAVATTYEMKKELRQKIKLVFQWSRRLIKIVNLGIIIYGFANAEHTSFSLLLVAFSILSWGLDLIIGIISFILTSWLQLFFLGVETDLDEYKEKITAPFTATGNFFKRMAGKEVIVPEKPEPTAKQKMLSEMVETEREEKAQRKEEKKADILRQKIEAKEERKAQKKEEKATKKAEKKAKKELQRNPTPSVLEETAISED